MSGADDTLPPAAPVTQPLPPDPPSTPDLAPIRAGEAQQALSRALDVFAAAFVNVEATAMACARALDATASKVSR
jgi:hypothetical protein